jgi:hypothetical protein
VASHYGTLGIVNTDNDTLLTSFKYDNLNDREKALYESTKSLSGWLHNTDWRSAKLRIVRIRRFKHGWDYWR